MKGCGPEIINDTYFMRIRKPLSVNSRVSTKSNYRRVECRQIGNFVKRVCTDLVIWYDFALPSGTSTHNGKMQ